MNINIIYKKSMETDFINFCAAIRQNYNLGMRVVNNMKKHFGAETSRSAKAASSVTVPAFLRLQAAAYHHQEPASEQPTLEAAKHEKSSFDAAATSEQYVFIIPLRPSEDGRKQYMLSHPGSLESIKSLAKYRAGVKGVLFEDSMIVKLHIPPKEYEDNFRNNKGIRVDQELIDEFMKRNEPDQNIDEKKLHL